MPRRDMAYLMSEHTRKFRFIIKMRHNSPGNVYVAPGHCKRIQHFGIDYPELIVQIGAMRNCSHLLTLCAYEILYRLILI